MAGLPPHQTSRSCASSSRLGLRASPASFHSSATLRQTLPHTLLSLPQPLPIASPRYTSAQLPGSHTQSVHSPPHHTAPGILIALSPAAAAACRHSLPSPAHRGTHRQRIRPHLLQLNTPAAETPHPAGSSRLASSPPAAPLRSTGCDAPLRAPPITPLLLQLAQRPAVPASARAARLPARSPSSLPGLRACIACHSPSPLPTPALARER